MVKITERPHGKRMVQVTDDNLDTIHIVESSFNNTQLEVHVDPPYVVLKQEDAAALAAALAHFAETGRLPEPGQGGDTPSLRDQITGLRAYIAIDEHTVQRQLEHLHKQVHERLDDHEKRIEALKSDATYFIKKNERRIVELESQVKALKKDLEANDV